MDDSVLRVIWVGQVMFRWCDVSNELFRRQKRAHTRVGVSLRCQELPTTRLEKGISCLVLIIPMDSGNLWNLLVPSS